MSAAHGTPHPKGGRGRNGEDALPLLFFFSFAFLLLDVLCPFGNDDGQKCWSEDFCWHDDVRWFSQLFVTACVSTARCAYKGV